MSDTFCELCGTRMIPSESECQACKTPKEGIASFSEAKIDALERATLIDGVKVECGEGRSVEVWRVKEEDGYCIRIFRPTNDSKISKLVFGLKPPAANALMIALSRHINGTTS
jgi:hypothetical protein